MKKSLLVLAVAMLSVPAFANDDALESEDPTANFQASGETGGLVKFVNGKILQSTCKVEVDSVTKVVQLPSVQSSIFETLGKTAGDTPFTLNLADCPKTYVDVVTGEKKSRVGIKFTESKNITQDNGRLINTATKVPAKNVELQILSNGSSNPINLNDNTNNDSHQPIGGKFQILSYTARYISTGDVEAGNFETSVPFIIEYK